MLNAFGKMTKTAMSADGLRLDNGVVMWFNTIEYDVAKDCRLILIPSGGIFMLQLIPYSRMHPTRISYFNCIYRNAIVCHY